MINGYLILVLYPMLFAQSRYSTFFEDFLSNEILILVDLLIIKKKVYIYNLDRLTG